MTKGKSRSVRCGTKCGPTWGILRLGLKSAWESSLRRHMGGQVCAWVPYVGPFFRMGIQYFQILKSRFLALLILIRGHAPFTSLNTALQAIKCRDLAWDRLEAAWDSHARSQKCVGSILLTPQLSAYEFHASLSSYAGSYAPFGVYVVPTWEFVMWVSGKPADHY